MPKKKEPQLEWKQCWEIRQCGREPGGKNSEELGVCPAALPSDFDGVNSGKYGGRFCWSVAGTLCGGTPQGTYCDKITSCLSCEFLQQVELEEGPEFVLTPQHAILKQELTDSKKKKK